MNMNMKLKMCVCWWLLSLVIAAPVALGQLKPEVESVLKDVDQKMPGLGAELRQLASTSANAKHLLDIYFADGVQRPEDYPTSASKLVDHLWSWSGFASAAYQAADNDFGILLAKYPLITTESRLLAGLKNEDGRSVLISSPLTGTRFDSHGRFMPAGEIMEVDVVDGATGQLLGSAETEAQDFKVVHEHGKDFFALIRIDRGSSFTHTQGIITQTFSITKKGTFELRGEKTEIVPWPPSQELAPQSSSVAVSPTSRNGNASTQTGTKDAVVPTPATVPKLPAARPIPPSVETTSTRAPRTIVVATLSAAIGLLWLVLKRRVK